MPPVTLVVAGALANKLGNGGEAWVRLSYALGLQKLGFRVHFVEQIARATCVNSDGAQAPFEGCQNRAYFQQVVEEFGLADAATLVYGDGEQTQGLRFSELLDLAESAELLLNVSGHLALDPLMRRLRRKVYLDIDPGFTQFWHAHGNLGARLGGHDDYFTIGENIGTAACSIPTGDIRWRHTRPPVVLEQWPVQGAGQRDRFTTVANWRGPFGALEFGGRTYGLKVHEFRKLLALPERAPGTYEIALNIHPADDKDLRLLKEQGWRIVDPRLVAAEPLEFRRYVQGSGAEFSVAQGVYVDTASGWFSDRTVRYLASGKPVLVQDTGFSHIYPVGEGLVPFRTLDEAVSGAESIVRDYERHARAARALAAELFDSDRVLTRLLEEVGVAP
jgi:hypothetical protein